jgi:hypothetical protein
MFIVTTVHTIRTLTGDYLAFIHSVLQAHGPIYSLLNSVVCWCSQYWHRSWTQLSTHSLFHYAVRHLQSPFTLSCTLTICSTQHPYLPWHDSPPAEGWSCMSLMCFLTIHLCPSQSSGNIWHSVFFSQKHCHTGSSWHQRLRRSPHS